MYKLEMHVHTSPTSRCASAKAEDAVTKLPDAMFDKATDFTRRNVYAAYKMEE